MDDVSDIRFIDTHTECHCRHYYVDLIDHPSFLDGLLLLLCDVGMVICRLVPISVQLLADLFTRLSGKTIDDA